MVRIIAPLVYYDRVDGTYIKMGTGSWLHWLARNRSFRYESFWGSFMACKEYRGQEVFWIAYRRFKDQQRCSELGASEDLTLDNLLDTAKKLSASNMAPWEGKHQIQDTPESYRYQPEVSSKFIETHFDTQTNSKEIELLHQVSDLREQVSKLQKQLEQERRINLTNDASAKFLWN